MNFLEELEAYLQLRQSETFLWQMRYELTQAMMQLNCSDEYIRQLLHLISCRKLKKVKAMLNQAHSEAQVQMPITDLFELIDLTAQAEKDLKRLQFTSD